MNVMLFLLDALHFGYNTFRGSSTTPWLGYLSLIFFFHPAITLSTTNLITLCSYSIQLSTTLYEQLRTIIHNVMCVFFDCRKDKDKALLDVTINASITGVCRNFKSWIVRSHQDID